MSSHFRLNERVVFTTDKYTSSPGPRAKNVVAAPNGESYAYQVDKYWMVTEIRSDGNLVLQTRRGKKHVLAADDPRLRKANLVEKLLKGKQFPSQQPEPGLISAAVK